ncbi:transposable element Tcb1 transposase [Trichonephila clavipes]|nr:transposable element Tcb1 transposase [Trichonephila clavipes]
MVWGVITYNTRSTLGMIRGTMKAQQYVHDTLQHVLSLIQRLPGAIFLTRQCSASHGKGVSRMFSHCYYPSLACPIHTSYEAYLGSFVKAIWASHKFERTRGQVTANMGRNVSRYHIEYVCLNARSYLIVLSR